MKEMYLKLELGISKVGGYDFPHPCDDTRTVTSFSSGP
jgi:hypothetical protein